MNTIKKLALAVVVAALALAPGAAYASGPQLTSNVSTVAVSLVVGSTITESCTPSAVTLTYNAAAGGTAATPTTISCVTSWNLDPAQYSNVTVDSYLGSATAALTNGTLNIASSKIFVSFNGATAAACTGGPDVKGGVAAGTMCSTFFYGPGTGSRSQTMTPSGTSTDTYLLSASGLGALNPSTYSGNFSSVAYAE